MNPQQQDSPRQGFTIIEVVLVLAIAGLIFLMVFLALPAMQRSQRDTTRKEDLSRLSSAIISYQSNNNGKFPTNIKDVVDNYITKNGGSFNDPTTGEPYEVDVKGDKSSGSKDKPKSTQYGTIYVDRRAYCNGEEPATDDSVGSFAVVTPAESGSYICVSN